MTPERWQRLKEIFQAATQRAPGERSAFLANACGDDESMRREVESLIASHEKSGEFIDSPAYEGAAEMIGDHKDELKPGQTIGAYEIVSFISRGGMGEVYLAQDRRLGRSVALKLLPSSWTKDVSRLLRFEQEARAASALNHPNIITIYEIREANGNLMIVTEFVEGETLRQRILTDKPEPNKALDIAIQIADALSAAHRAGIIHRDIKPDNIMIRPDGYIKVLDFGLAKLTEPAEPASNAEAPTRKVKTGSGMIMGTIGYMSPEQARGQTVDARSDIFNLGAVIYEMVSGQQPFAGDTPSDILAAILKSEPLPLSQLTNAAPPELVRIVTKALRKDREERYQVIKDLLLDLKSLKEDLDFQAKLDRSVAPNKNVEATGDRQVELTRKVPSKTGETKTYVSTLSDSLGPETRRRKTAIIVTSAAVALAVIVGIIALFKYLNRNSPPVETPQVVRTTQLTFSTGLDQFPSLSPDGNSVAYSSDQKGSFEIYVKQLTPGGQEIQLTADGSQNLQPAWSPDGQRVAYFSRNRGGIWIVPALGGTPKQLVEFGACPGWSHDGSTIVFQSGASSDVGESRAMAPSTIWSISAAGGKPRQITQQGKPTGGHSSPAWSPDGKHIAFQASEYGPTSVWQISVDGTGLTRIAERGGDPLYARDGSEIYVTRGRSDAGFSRIRLSPTTGEPIGPPEAIVSAGAGFRMRDPAISSDGKKIAYTVARTSSTLWSISLSGKSAGPPAPFASDTSLRNTNPRFSHDGHKVALSRNRAGTGTDIWLADADGKNQTQLTTDSADDNWPNWFPRDDKIMFLSTRQGKHLLLAITLATGKEEPLLELDESAAYPSLSPDGTHVAFNSNKTGTINMWIVSLSGGEPKQLTFSDKDRMGFPSWSPDGRFLSFLASDGEKGYIMIMPASGGPPTQLTFEGESFVHSWSSDGERLAFVGERKGIWNVYLISRTTKEQKQLTDYTKLNAFVRYSDWSPLGNQIIYEYAETTGNIWLMELK